MSCVVARGERAAAALVAFCAQIVGMTANTSERPERHFHMKKWNYKLYLSRNLSHIHILNSIIKIWCEYLQSKFGYSCAGTWLIGFLDLTVSACVSTLKGLCDRRLLAIEAVRKIRIFDGLRPSLPSFGSGALMRPQNAETLQTKTRDWIWQTRRPFAALHCCSLGYSK